MEAYTTLLMEVFIRLIADGMVVLVVLIGLYALIVKVPAAKRYEVYCRILLAGLTAFLVAKLIATIYQGLFPGELRPFQEMGIAPGAAYLNNPGFPSDHALFVTSILLAVWFETKNKLLAGLLLVLAIMVGFGRVIALVHTPLDVIGGVFAACVGALWYLTAPTDKKRFTKK